MAYILEVNGVRRLYGDIDKKRPGWKQVWVETLRVLNELKGELEGGVGLRSHAFQPTPSE